MRRPPDKLLKALEEAETLQRANKISKAAQAGRTAYALALEYLPPGHPERMRAARVLGLLLINLNQKAEAERLLRESGDLQADGEIEAQIAARNTEATLKIQQGVTEEVVDFAGETLYFARQHLPLDHPGATMALANMGMICEQTNDLKMAEEIFAEVLSKRRLRPADTELLGAALLDLARIYLRTDRVPRCEPLYREALQIARASGQKDLGLAVILNQYGAVRLRMGYPEDARALLEESLELRRSILGADHPQVATALHGLADVYSKLEEYEKVEEVLTLAGRLTERALGSDHPKTLQYLTERGVNLMGLGPDRAREGLALVRRAYAKAQLLPTHDPTRAKILHFHRLAETLAEKMELHD